MNSQETDRPDQQAATGGERGDVDARQVADYLRRHPDFFEHNRSLLEQLRVPHAADGAVSLVERQVALLREGNKARQRQLDGLIQIARDNERLNEQLHQLVLQLMACTDLATLLEMLYTRLRRDFSADYLALRLLHPPANRALAGREEFVADPDGFRGPFQRLLGAGRPRCGGLKPEQLQALFGDHAESVASTALLPLGKQGGLGLLAIGSAERDRFNASMDTAFLQRLSEAVAAALGRFL